METTNLDNDLDRVVFTDDLPQQERRGKVLFFLGSILGILLILGVGVISFYYVRMDKKGEEKVVAEAVVTPQTTVVAPQLKKGEVTVEVLNASGKAGEALRVKTKVQSLGYSVVSIGNSEKKQVGLGLYLSNSLLGVEDLLLADLQKEYVGMKYSGVLENSTAAAQIIIGK